MTKPVKLNNSMNLVAAQLIKCPYKIDIHPITVAKFQIDIVRSNRILTDFPTKSIRSTVE